MERKFAVSEANTRTSKKWKINEYSLEEMKEKLSHSIETNETAIEFKKMTKEEKTNIKDVGGMLPGRLKKEGRRQKESVESLSMVALDADNPKEELIEDLELLLDCLIIIHSTHSHTDEQNRLRFYLPLSRDVTPEEYGAISRKIANTIGMSNFDKTTFDQNRLMFFPSHSKDTEPLFKIIGENLLDPADILAQYEDWHDVSEWPRHKDEEKGLQREVKKMGDPLEKSGLIGAFNRTYSISSAIQTFLSDIYSETSADNRFTYLGGSTWGGLVVHDDLFAHSFHSTDPISGKSVNAYDLVRVHKFGELDEEAKTGTPVIRLPSTKAMNEFVSKDNLVNSLISQEKAKEAAEDFGDIEEVDAVASLIEKLEKDHRLKILPNAYNLKIIMSEDPNLKGKFCNDEFAHRWTIIGDLPWRKYRADDVNYWSDTDDAGLRVYLEIAYGISSRSKVADALRVEMTKNSVHPVREYLNTLTWDGVNRAETLLIDYLGAVDTYYTRIVTRKWLAGAVARVLQPGIKFDYMLVTVGEQGLGKSTLMDKLAGAWFSDSLSKTESKESYEALQGVWIMELGEMFITKKADIEQTKHFITKRTDAFRVAFGHYKEVFPRQNVFYGSTNDRNFLRDKSGNRRFWPVDVFPSEAKYKARDINEETRAQIWAEVCEIWKRGELLYLNDEDEKLAKAEQEAHRETGELEGMIDEFLQISIPNDWYEKTIEERQSYIRSYFGDDMFKDVGSVKRERVSTIEIWCELLEGRRENLQPVKRAEITNILDSFSSWKRYKNNNGRYRLGREYGLQTVWVRYQR